MTTAPQTGAAELLACPFCGSEPVLDDFNTSYRHDSKPLWGVICRSRMCADEIGFFNGDKTIAIAEWNTRTPTNTPASQTDAMMEAFRLGWRLAGGRVGLWTDDEIITAIQGEVE